MDVEGATKSVFFDTEICKVSVYRGLVSSGIYICMGMVLLMVVVVVDQWRKMTAGGRVLWNPRRRLGMPVGMPRMRAMGVPRMRIMGVPRVRAMGMPRMRTMGAPCFVA